MKTIIRTEYGGPDVLRLVEIEKPVPGDDEVLVRVRASSINAADRYLMRGEPLPFRLDLGLRRPKNARLGADVAGTVEAIGRHVTAIEPGDAVYGDLSGSNWGAWAEFAVAPAAVLAPMPSNLSFEQAGAVPLAAVTALQGLRDGGNLASGHRVLIHGASGGVGTFAVQIAKALGAEVTAVVSPRNLELARSLGADRVIDYTTDDFSRDGSRYDLILAANGNRSLGDYRRALTEGGTLVNSGGGMGQTFRALLLGPLVSATSRQSVRSLMAKPNRDDLIFLNGLIEAGQVAPVIDDCYRLAETAAGMRYMEETRPRGKVVISLVERER